MVPLAEIRSFDQYTVIVDGESGRCQSGIEMRTAGVPIRMALGLSDAELDWLRFQLNDHLSGLGGRKAAGETPPQEPAAAVASPAAPSRRRRLHRARAGSQAGRPAQRLLLDPRGRFRRLRLRKARAARLRDGPGPGIHKRILERHRLGVCGHIVGTTRPSTTRRSASHVWGVLVFLIPFEVVGLIMVGALLAALLEPVHRTVWTFARQGIEHRTAWLGLGPRRTWEVMSLGRIDLRRETKAFRRAFPAVLRR